MDRQTDSKVRRRILLDDMVDSAPKRQYVWDGEELSADEDEYQEDSFVEDDLESEVDLETESEEEEELCEMPQRLFDSARWLLEWCWLCGQETSDSVLRRGDLDDIFNGKADPPRIERRLDIKRGHCVACKLRRNLTHWLHWDNGCGPIGEDCAIKLEQVTLFFNHLGWMQSACEKGDRARALSNKAVCERILDTVSDLQEDVFSKYDNYCCSDQGLILCGR